MTMMNPRMMANKIKQSQSRQHQFSCRNCGSAIVYHIGEQSLQCISCSATETIKDSHESIQEFSLEKALSELRLKPLTVNNKPVLCDNCGAHSDWDVNSLSDLCPYCATPIAKLDTENQRLQIEAIVPFCVEKSIAFDAFSQWIKRRWFAPNVLKQMAGHSKQFTGIYIPHWTFDSLTYTDYRGLRGENYIEYVTQTRTVNGKTQHVEVPVTKVRWYRAVGQVRLMFDDILVLAAMLIPKTIVNQLRPWQLNQATPYTADYLAGLKAQYYQLDLDEAFVIAQQRMSRDIDIAIRHDIGGDQQRIQQKKTRYQNSTYKLILLPVWHSSFEYKGKQYQFVINGQTAKVAGQYPKSPIKIAAAIIVSLIVLGLVIYYFREYL